MYLSYSSLRNSERKCDSTTLSIITVLLLLIVCFTLIFISTVNHSGLSDKEKLSLSIIHSISAFCVLLTSILLCIYIRFHLKKVMRDTDDDDEERGTIESWENVSIRLKKIQLKCAKDFSSTWAQVDLTCMQVLEKKILFSSWKFIKLNFFHFADNWWRRRIFQLR